MATFVVAVHFTVHAPDYQEAEDAVMETLESLEDMGIEPFGLEHADVQHVYELLLTGEYA